MSFGVKVDTSALGNLFKGLDPKTSESIARTMLVAGGSVVRDEAATRVNEGPTGKLKNALYLAYRNSMSGNGEFRYSVSWNSRKAPHGHLVEFGHWQPFVVTKRDGKYITTKKRRPDGPKWVHPKPFLRPALEATRGGLFKTMLDAGKRRFAELVRGGSQ
jgi:hypothetical protein